MKEKVITENSAGKLTVKWDGSVFGIVGEDKITEEPPKVIILNPREMTELVKFAGSLGGD